jgi:hypothetical protein
MQLTSPVAGRNAAALLALATSRLLGAPEAQALDLTGLSVEQATLVYQEQGRVNIVEPVLHLRLPLPGERALGMRYGFDSMSGASPNGAAPAATLQTFTSASGRGYSAAPGELPVREFRDQRHAVGLDWEQPLTRTLRLDAGLSGSFEMDYRSLGASATLSQDLNQRLTTLTMGLSLSQDRLRPKGGVPEPLGDYQDRVSTGDAASKQIRDGLVGITQVMNRRWLTQLNLGAGRDRGWLTDPYKGISLVDDAGAPVSWLNESRPASRTRWTLFWANAVHLGRDVLHADLRRYQDSWGVRATTADLQYWWKPEAAPGLRVRPELRWSLQSRADGYAHSWPATQALPEHLTADARLAGMTSWTLALRLDLPAADWGQLWIKPAWMRQRFDLSPAPLGAQHGLDLTPDLRAWMVTLGYRTTL